MWRNKNNTKCQSDPAADGLEQHDAGFKYSFVFIKMIALIGACPAISSRNKEAQMACHGVFQIDAGLQGIHACRIAFVLVVHGFDMLETMSPLISSLGRIG